MANNQTIKGNGWNSVVETLKKVSDNRLKKTTEQELIAAPQSIKGNSDPAKLVRYGLVNQHDLVWCWEHVPYGQRKMNFRGVMLVVDGEQRFFNIKDQCDKAAFNLEIQRKLKQGREEWKRAREVEKKEREALDRALNAKANN